MSREIDATASRRPPRLNRSRQSFPATGGLRALDNGLAVRHGAEFAHIRLVGAGNRQGDRLGAGREQQPIEGYAAPVGQHYLVRPWIDFGHSGLEPQLRAVKAGARKAIPLRRSKQA